MFSPNIKTNCIDAVNKIDFDLCSPNVCCHCEVLLPLCQQIIEIS